MTHEDFEGHRGTIKAGDVQWMTAGRGIVHSEMPAGPGTSKGLQLWVNLLPQQNVSVFFLLLFFLSFVFRHKAACQVVTFVTSMQAGGPGLD